MKKVLLCLFCLLSLPQLLYAYDFSVDEFSYNILSEEDATVVLAKGTAPTKSNHWPLPSFVIYNGKRYSVVEIGEKAIYNISTRDLSIEIPASIQRIGDYGISACWYIYWITIEKSEEPLYVGKGFLNSCSSLETAEIFRQIVYEEGASSGFKGKGKLKDVYIRDGYHNINQQEFQACSSLEIVSISTPIYSIGQGAFQNTPNLRMFNTYDWDKKQDNIDFVSEMGNSAFAKSGIPFVILPLNLKEIPTSAFANCVNIKNVHFDMYSTTEVIGINAFNGCTNLESLYCYDSLKRIDRNAFDGCTSLKHVEFIGCNDSELLFNASYNNTTFFKDAPIEDIYLDRNIILYNGSISGCPFENNSTLTKVTFGSHCTVLPMSLFSNCSSLSDINFEDSHLTEIGIRCFSRCIGIKGTIRMPETLEIIRTSAFAYCENALFSLNDGLKYLGEECFRGTDVRVAKIPGTVTEMHNAFVDCTELKSCIFEDGLEKIGFTGNPFKNCPLTSLILGRNILPSGIFFGEARMQSVAPFKDNTTIENIRCSSTVTDLPDGTFWNCTSLSSIDFGDDYSIETIGSRVFYNCSALTEFTCPSTVKSIGNFCFNGCTNLKRVSFVSDTRSLEPIKLGQGNEYYNQALGMFYQCPLESVLIGKDIDYSSEKQYNAYSPFYGISTLNLVSFSEGVTEIGPYMFENCIGLKSITLSPSIKAIQNRAFAGCESLEFLSLGTGMEKIERYAFSGCPLTQVNTLATTPPMITTDFAVFDTEVYSKANLKIPKGTITSYNTADVWKEFYKISNEGDEDIFVHAITIDKDHLSLIPGKSDTLSIIITPKEAAVKELKWESSHPDIAIVDNGIVKAISDGGVVITAKTTDGSNLIASCDVIIPKIVSAIVLDTTQVTLSIGQVFQLTASILPDMADNKTLEWTSDNKMVATVDQSGRVTAKGQGRTVITAKSTDGADVSASCEITVIRLVSRITLDKGELTLSEGESSQLTATVLPALADNKTLEWSSDNESVATVDQLGKVTALSQGKTVITVKSTDGSDVTASCEVTVVKLVSDITLDKTELTLSEGETSQLTATVSPMLADNKTLEWSSDNESVATVDQSGEVTAISQGKAVITVKSTDGSDVMASCDVTVVKLVSSITLDKTELTLSEGETSQLTAMVSPALAGNKTLEWSSDNESVATVDQSGMVTAVSQGKTVITVKSTDGSDVTASCAVTVVKLVSGITLDKTELTLSEGEAVQLTATVLPALADNKTLEWSSDNESVATVDQSGKVIALSQGKAIITVKSTDGSDVMASCDVTVVKLVSSITFDKTDLTLTEGETSQLTATISPALADNKTLEWSSDNESVATVDQSGMVTAVSQGKTVITVKSTDGSDVTASCEVSVVKLMSEILLSETEIYMSVGEYAVITANVIPEDATHKELAWESSNTEVARVENGIIIAISDGNARIKVSSADGSNISAFCDVIVRTLVSEISLNETELKLKVGEFATLEASVSPYNATCSEIAWNSSDESVADVKNGLVLAFKEGTAIITAMAADGSNIKAECLVEVYDLDGLTRINMSNVSVSVINSQIVVKNVPQGIEVRLIQTDGLLNRYITSNGEDIIMSPYLKGVYFVAIGNQIYKVILI